MRERLARLGGRLRSEWPMKAWLGAVLGTLFLAGYGAAQRMPLREPILLRPSWLDDCVPFDPRWAWAYHSLYLLLPFAWLARSRDELWRYAVGFLTTGGIGLAAFVLVPTGVPRPPMPIDAGIAYRWLVALDLPVNCFPSLHVALAAFTIGFAVAVLKPATRSLVATLAVWLGVIAYSTLATKQHYLLDVPAGLLVGWIGHRVAWLPARRSESVVTFAATEGRAA